MLSHVKQWFGRDSNQTSSSISAQSNASDIAQGRPSDARNPSANLATQLLADTVANGPYTDMKSLLNLAAAGGKINLAKATYALSRSSGTHHSNQRGRGMEFLESRHYQAGDDIRSIDWRVTARTGKTHTKVFAEEREQPVFVLCDQSPYMFFGSQVRFKSVQASNVAGLIAWSCLSQGDRFGGEIIGPNNASKLFKLSRNRARMLQFLEQMTEMNHQLNSHQVSDFQSMTTKLQQLKYILPPGTRLYIVTDLYALTEEALKALAQLSAHAQITLFAINDPLEIEPPKAGQCQINLGNQVLSVTLSEQQQRTINDKYQNTLQQVTRYLINWNIPLIKVSTLDCPIELFNTQSSRSFRSNHTSLNSRG